MQSRKRFQLPIAIIRHLTPNHSPALHPPKLNVFAQISWVVQGKAGVLLASAAPAQGHNKIVVMGGILVLLSF